MNRKIKALGLALVAALALTAVMASAASANFTSTAAHTVLSGSQVGEHKFTAGTGIGAISCKKLTFAGTGTSTSEPTRKIKPSYSECKDSLGRIVHVNTGTAEYEFTSTGAKGLFHIVGGNITFTVTGSNHCTITYTSGAANINKTKVSYTQEGNKLKTVTSTDNIHSHIAGGAFACGTNSTTSVQGTYFGTTLMEANGGFAKISVH